MNTPTLTSFPLPAAQGSSMPVIFLRLLFGAMLCLASIPFQASARDWTGNGALILGGGGVFSGNLVVTNTISGAQKFYRLVNP